MWSGWCIQYFLERLDLLSGSIQFAIRPTQFELGPQVGRIDANYLQQGGDDLLELPDGFVIHGQDEMGQFVVRVLLDGPLVGGDGLIRPIEADIATAQSIPGVGIIRTGFSRPFKIGQGLFVFSLYGEAGTLAAERCRQCGTLPRVSDGPLGNGGLRRFVGQHFKCVYGDGKVKILTPGHLKGDHANHLSVVIEHRTAAGSPGDRGGQLKHRSTGRHLAHSRNDSFGNGLFQTHWAADYENTVRNGGLLPGKNDRRRPAARDIHADLDQIDQPVFGQDRCHRVLTAVHCFDACAVGTFQNVEIGHQYTAFCNEESAADG